MNQLLNGIWGETDTALSTDAYRVLYCRLYGRRLTTRSLIWMLGVSCAKQLLGVFSRVFVCALFTKEMRYSASSVWSNIVALEK